MIALESIGVDTAAFQNGEKLYRRGLVSQPIEVENGLRYEVGGTDVQSVTFTRRGETLCTCGETEQPCQHVTAALLRAESDGTLKRFQQENELALGQRMLSALNRAMPGGETVRLLAVLRLYEDGRIGRAGAAVRRQKYRRPAGLLRQRNGADPVPQVYLPARQYALFPGGRALSDGADELYSSEK